MGITLAGQIIGGVAGILSSTALGYLAAAYKPVMNTQLKNIVLDLGLGLAAGCAGVIVGDTVAREVDETIDIIEEFRKEVNSRKAEENGRA